MDVVADIVIVFYVGQIGLDPFLGFEEAWKEGCLECV